MLKKTHLAALLSTILLTACQSIPTTTAPANTPINTSSSAQAFVYDTTLDNGLRVLIKQDKRAPLVVTQIWYNVGSNDEPVGKGGLSHFLEHLMFKDAKGLSASEYNNLMTYLGGNLNAFTSNDYTAYYEVLPANQYPVALQIEANRMKNLLFKAEEIATEKQVVQEERRLRTENNPTAQAYEILRQTALPNSPKGRPIIGSMSDIESLNESDLRAWYQRYYNPNNATLVLVGDVEPTEAMVWVRRYFDSLTNHPSAITQPNLTQPTHRGYHQFNSPQFVPTPQLSMAFNTPSLTSQTGAADAYALALLSDIADGGLSARFEKQLIREQGVLSSVGLSYSPFDKGDTLFTIHATPKEGVDLATAENAILAVLANINAQNIDDNELLRGQNNLVSSLVFDNDSMENQAVMLGMLATMGLPIDSMDKEVLPKKFAQVTKTDIEKVGKKYLTRDNLTTQYILPIEQNK